MPQAEPAGRQALGVGRAGRAAVLHVGRVHVGGQRGDERVEDVGGEGDERREGGVGVWEGDLEAED